MENLLGSEAEALLGALQQEAVTGLRVNTLKVSPADLTNLWSTELNPEPRTLHPVPWCPSGFTLSGKIKAGKHPYHAAGLYYMQEPSAMAVAEALAPQKDELILDLAAAPGGKTTHIAALTGNKSIVVANEIHQGRTKALSENLERVGATQSVVTNEEVSNLVRQWGAIFDRVLLDAPCSGEGMFRKSAEALEMWSEETVLGCAKRQTSLLSEAAKLVKAGGHLVYSTCTFAPEENEYVIAKFLKEHPEFELRALELPGTAHGRPEWLPEDLYTLELSKTLRLFPHQLSGEGHFVARLQKTSGLLKTSGLQKTSGETATINEAIFHPVSKEVKIKWLEVCQATFREQPFADKQLTMFGEKLFAVPERVPHLRGLKALRTGVYLGSFQGNGQKARFEPSHSLALAVTKNEIGESFDLSPNDEQLLRYLQGHELEHFGEDGWLLITVSGFPLGWGRRSKNIIKNAYPKGLRVS
jgi:NOL1/NOP2/sun family putative RNA methylase